MLSVDIFNVIRDSASTNYHDYVPIASPDQNSIREIGKAIMEYNALRDEFLRAVVSRIGCVFKNHKPVNKMSEIFVNIVNPFEYNYYAEERKVHLKEFPDNDNGFYILIYHDFYTISVHNKTFEQSFISWNGITDLIMKIIYSMYICLKYHSEDIEKEG